MKQRRIVSTVLISAILLLSWFKITYLYTPFDFPGGNLSGLNIRWSDIKRPLTLEFSNWDNGSSQYLVSADGSNKSVSTILIGDNYQTIKYILKSFAGFKKIDKPDSKTWDIYKGKEFTVIIRMKSNQNNGRILLQFTFYEKSKVAQIDGVYFYEITDDFRQKIDNIFKQ